jgi:hypothetical protein
MKLNLKTFMLLGTTGLVSVMPTFALADVRNDGTVTIEANKDQISSGEYIYLNVAGQNQMTITEGGTTINDQLSVNGRAIVGGDIGLSGDIYSTNDPTVTVRNNLIVTGATDLDNGLNVLGQTTIDVGINEGNRVALTHGSAEASEAFESIIISFIDKNNSEHVANEIFMRARLISGEDGEEADIHLIAADDVNIDTGDDLEVDSKSKIQLHADDDIELDSGDNVEVVATDDIEMTATRILGATGNASSVMQNGSIMNSVASGEGLSGGSVIANNGSARMIADENGKIVVNDGTDTTTGTTASMYVTNSAGNVHGLVVQETKTTLSGGTNSASMTLDDRGATFSNPVDGSPIQVHGVADGTAPFDAVNVRQLYSGLAAVLASTPDIALAPGRTGMAVGMGGYGGYNAIGLGFGHMYENGVTLKVSASKAQHSELAYRASASWNW